MKAPATTDTHPHLPVPCCPDLVTDKACDVIDFHYRTTHRTVVEGRVIPVEVLIHARFERCPGPLALGDIAYSTTLLPGEKVKLFTSDRRTQFSFDSATSLSYRNAQTSEESYYMSSMSDFMSDLSVRDHAHSSNKSSGSATGHAETSGAIESFFAGPSVDVSGSYNAESTSDFLRELSQHAQSSHRRSEQGTRTASSVSVGEVQTRSHAEGQTQDHFESASREFANPNKCHAITFFFYRINKTQTIKFTIESIERRVIDPAADTKVAVNPFVSRGDVSVVPTAILATADNRLAVEARARQSVAAAQDESVGLGMVGRSSVLGSRFAAAAAIAPTAEPLPAAVRQAALKQVDATLAGVGLLDKTTGRVTEETKKKFSFEVTSSLPTPGLLVRGCIDDCDICEPARKKEIELDLVRKDLENQLLKKQIELLEKSQEYRCCPEGEAEEDEGDED
jgi:hypothetical protein